MTNTPGNVSRLSTLSRERDDLLRSLEDLEIEHGAGDITTHDYDRLRMTYIARTGALLDEIAMLESNPDLDVAPHSSSMRLRRRLGRRNARRVLISLIALWVLAGAALVALHFAGVRLPGESATGSISLSQALVVQQQLTQASDLAGTGNVAQAIAVYGQVLAKVPHQHEALTYQGWLIRLSGVSARKQNVIAKGDAEIARAVSIAPSYPDARGLYGVALADDLHDFAGAVAQFEAMARDHPSATLLGALDPQVRVVFQRAKVAIPSIFRSSASS